MNDTRPSTPALAVWLERDDSLLRLRLSRPKANLIDAQMIAALSQAFAEHGDRTGIKAVLLDHEGSHFSFGASVEEHLPDQCAQMLAGLHALIRAMLEFPAPILVAIRGQCLGGGLEVAMSGSLLFAAPDARLGQPEIRLGVFAPAASSLLPMRIGQAASEEMLFSGRSLDAQEALANGLVFAVSDDPQAAALAWFDAQLADKSASVLALAVQAVRAPYRAEAKRRIEEVERLYLEALMKTHDANEGLRAFVERRKPEWNHR
ncbi:MAG: cyclohexa-1,5-dienecarbonyl-CoA hydratase [Burkholderiaceae bacterium]|nr:cyclohexa-1,5-dienecarbonyl-CoA hydratase [Burkholderiaceae bacterium]